MNKVQGVIELYTCIIPNDFMKVQVFCFHIMARRANECLIPNVTLPLFLVVVLIQFSFAAVAKNKSPL